MKTLPISYIFVLLLCCAFACKGEKNKQVTLPDPNRKVAQNRGINLTRVIVKSDKFYQDLVNQTSFTSEDIALFKQVEQELIAKYGPKLEKKGAKSRFKDLQLERKVKIRESLNNDKLYLEYSKFDENNKKKANQLKKRQG